MSNFNPPKNRLWQTWLCFFAATMSFFAIDMYAPAFVEMSQLLHTTEAHIQTTLMAFLISFSLSQLVYGPLSDAYGRRPIILISLLIGLIGGVFAIVAPSIEWLTFGRFIQGLGLGGTMCITRTVFRDMFQAHELARVSSWFGFILGTTLAFSPIVGAYINAYFGWRGIFLLLNAGIAIVTFLLMRQLIETNQHIDKSAILPKMLYRNYKMVLKHGPFMGYALAASLAITVLVVNLAISPFLFQNVLGMNPVEYSWALGILTAAMIVGRILNIILVSHLKTYQLVMMPLIVMSLGSIWLLWVSLYATMTTVNVMMPMMLVFAASGLVFTNTMSGALQLFKVKVGASSAIYSVLHMFGPAVGTMIAKLLPTHHIVGLASFWVCLLLLASSIFYFLVVRVQRTEGIAEVSPNPSI